MPNKKLEINLNAEIDFLTSKTAAHLVTAIFRELLYQRNQIPFVYSTFKFLISKWKPTDSQVKKNFNIERQRNLATTTCSDIEKLNDTINQAFLQTQNEILSVRLLFGATPQMPKEIYHIKLPQISNNIHPNDNIIQFLDSKIKQVLRNLLTTDQLYKTFSAPLSATNIFVDMEINHTTANANEVSQVNGFIMKDLIEFSPNCKEIIFNITNTPPPPPPPQEEHSNNCQKFQIFEEISIEDIENEWQIINQVHKQKQQQICWWEADYNVKGFKDIISKNKFNIWQTD